MSTTDDLLCFSYWTDPLCIWAYVAQSKLEALLAGSSSPLQVIHRIVPVFGSIPQRFATGSWSADGPEGRVRKTRDVAVKFGHEEVSGEIWVSDPPASSWPVGAAIKAVFAAEGAGECAPGSGPAYQWRLRQALFAENRNVARRAVQLEVAEDCQISRSSLEGRLDDGSAMAEPTYVFDGARETLYGNVPLALIRSTVEILIDDGAPGRSPC
jgi:predicted DsbA family dithiol-disulfide isomerase